MRYVIRERFFHLGEDSDITDDSGQTVLHVDGRVLSLHNTLVLRDTSHNEVARVERKLLTIGTRYEISVRGREIAEVRKQFFTPFREKYTIDIPGPNDLELSGNLLDHEFTVRRGSETVATISKQWFALRDTYGVDIAANEDALLILASVLALDLAEDRARNANEEQRD